jgi:hypothetical protein
MLSFTARGAAVLMRQPPYERFVMMKSQTISSEVRTNHP